MKVHFDNQNALQRYGAPWQLLVCRFCACFACFLSHFMVSGLMKPSVTQRFFHPDRCACYRNAKHQ